MEIQRAGAGRSGGGPSSHSLEQALISQTQRGAFAVPHSPWEASPRPPQMGRSASPHTAMFPVPLRQLSLTEVNSGPGGFCTRLLPGVMPPPPPVQPCVWELTAVNARCPSGSPPASLIQGTPGLSSGSLTKVQGSLTGGQESVGSLAGRTAVLSSSLTPFACSSHYATILASGPQPCSFSRMF